MNDDEIRRILSRAAQLQEQKAQQERSAAAALPQSSGAGDSDDASSGMDLEILKEAAAEVGIHSEDILIAAAEQKSSRHKPIRERLLKRAELALGSNQRVMRFAFQVKARPEDTPGIIRRASEAKPYLLTLESTFGDDLTVDGVMVFRTVGYENADAFIGTNNFVLRMLTLDVKKLFFTVRPAEGNVQLSNVVMVAPLDYSLSLNYKVDTGLSLSLGGIALVLGGLLLPFPPLAAWAAGAGMAGAGSWLTRVAYRASYRRSLRKGREAMEDLINAIRTEAMTI
jgi:hypothetical protein